MEEPKAGRDCFPMFVEMLVALMAARSRLVYEDGATLVVTLFELDLFGLSRVERRAEFWVEHVFDWSPATDS